MDFRTLVESSMDVLMQVTIGPGTFTPTYLSPSAEEVFGWSPNEMLQLPNEKVYSTASLAAMLADIRFLLSGCIRVSSVKLEAVRKDGRRIWLENRIRLLKDDGSGLRTAVVSLRDITARKLLQDQLAELVLLDALTGIGNRRAFEMLLTKGWSEALVARKPLSLVMIDVDHFKQINDAHGHQVGDECLRAIAEAIQRATRHPHAFLARYGGEELAILLPNCESIEAQAIAHDLRATVAALQLPQSPRVLGGGHLTVSCGVSTALVPAPAAARMPVALLEAADRALYTAKKRGRNRVEVEPLSQITAPEYTLSAGNLFQAEG